MKSKVKKFEEYLKNALNFNVDNDNEEAMLALQDVIMEFHEIFGIEEKSEANT